MVRYDRQISGSAILLLLLGSVGLAQEVNFQRDIQPILSSACFRCHGADASQRQAQLRLDQQEGLLADRGGYHAVVPGNAEDSQLFLRITSDDPDHQMPPADAVRQLSAQEVEQIRRWIQQGAEWLPHWSFVAPRRPRLPSVSEPAWPIRELDYFVLARLEQAGMRPAAVSYTHLTLPTKA